MKLYHGSTIDIEKILKPHRAFDREDYPPRIYFTDKIERALLYAVNPIEVYIKNKFNKDIHCSATSAHFYAKVQPYTLIEMYPNMFEETFRNRKTYIYVCDIEESELEARSENEYTINREIDFNDKIEIVDTFNEFMKLQERGLLKLLYCGAINYEKNSIKREHLIDSLNGRKNYCKSTEEESFFEMMSKHFPI